MVLRGRWGRCGCATIVGGSIHLVGESVAVLVLGSVQGVGMGLFLRRNRFQDIGGRGRGTS